MPQHGRRGRGARRPSPREDLSYRDAVQQSIDFIGQNHEFFVTLKARRLLDVVGRRVGDPRQARVLDVGCGIGATDRHLVQEVETCTGSTSRIR